MKVLLVVKLIKKDVYCFQFLFKKNLEENLEDDHKEEVLDRIEGLFKSLRKGGSFKEDDQSKDLIKHLKSIKKWSENEDKKHLKELKKYLKSSMDTKLPSEDHWNAKEAKERLASAKKDALLELDSEWYTTFDHDKRE